MVTYGEKLLHNVRKFSAHHTALYLGAEALQPFRDWRLLNYWTYKQLPEVTYFEHWGSSGAATTNTTRSLWVIVCRRATLVGPATLSPCVMTLAWPRPALLRPAGDGQRAGAESLRCVLPPP
jgi:hypothetical protein